MHSQKASSGKGCSNLQSSELYPSEIASEIGKQPGPLPARTLQDHLGEGGVGNLFFRPIFWFPLSSSYKEEALPYVTMRFN